MWAACDAYTDIQPPLTPHPRLFPYKSTQSSLKETEGHDD